jgi:hypothetical protein
MQSLPLLVSNWSVSSAGSSFMSTLVPSRFLVEFEKINKNGFHCQQIYYFGQSLPPSSFAVLVLNPTEKVLLFHHEQGLLWAAADLQLETGKRIEQFQCYQRMNDSFNGRKSVQQLSMVTRAA